MRHAVFLDDLGLDQDHAQTLLTEACTQYTALWKDAPRTTGWESSVDVLITSDHVVNEETVAGFPALKMVSLAFTGYDQVDLALCKSRNLHVYYVPAYSTNSVSELAVGLTLAVLRNIPRGDASARQGAWDSNGVQPGVELAGKTVGIVGLGRIGGQSAKRFQAFDCEVIGWNRTARDEFSELGITVTSLEGVFERADIVVLHLEANEETRGIVSDDLLRRMKKTAVLINTARASLVDTESLFDALRENRIMGAGIDVFDEEPAPTTNQLLKLGNVVATPHLGFKTNEALRRLAEETINNVGRYVRGDSTNRLLP